MPAFVAAPFAVPQFLPGERQASARLAVALLASLALHLALVARFGLLPFLSGAAEPSPLKVVLVERRPATPPTTESGDKRRPEPEPALRAEAPAKPRPAPRPSPSREVPSAAGASPPAKVPPVAAVVERADPIAAARPAAGLPFAGLSGRLRRVDIEFRVLGGDGGDPLTTLRQRYLADGDLYGISVESASESWQLSISGSVTPVGLSPTLVETRGAGADRLLALAGAEANGAGASGATRRLRLRDGLLDRQSLLYHFALQPPDLRGGTLWLSDGKGNARFDYRLAAPEAVPLIALGGARTVKLIVSAVGSPEVIELWLIPDMHYLPAKVRHTDGKGRVTEQVAVSLDFE